MASQVFSCHYRDGEKERMLNGDSPTSETTAAGDDTADMKRNMTSELYEPTEEDLAYKGWKHLIPFRSASK